MDYRRYYEPLFDVLIAGGILAPGGKILSTTKSEVCVFTCEPMVESVRGHVQLFVKLAMQRYKYLQKQLEEEMTKVLKFLKAFTEDERRSLAIFTGLSIAESLIPVSVISSLLTTEVIIKEGLSLSFSTVMFKTWINEKGMSHISSALRKKSLEKRLLELLPPTRRSAIHFDDHFTREGLEELVKFRKFQESSASRKKLQEEINEILSRDDDAKVFVDDIMRCCQEVQQNKTLTDSEITVLLWKCIMDSADISDTDQVIKHLKGFCPVFQLFCDQGTPQLSLLLKVQDYCHDNPTLKKAFYKIVYLFYNKDVITEQAIFKWYQEPHLLPGKGRKVFLEQMKPIVDWLETAEEESDSEVKDSQMDTT